MNINRSPRLRTARPLRSLPMVLDALESRLLLSSSHPAIPAANVAPDNLKITLSSDLLSTNTSISLTGTFTDKNATDTHNVTIAWGDGISSNVSLAAGITAIPATSHAYSVDGTYTITTTVADQTSAFTTASTTVAVLDSFDLVPSLKKIPKISNAIITGTSASATVSLTLINNGTTASPAATVSVFLRPLSGGADVPINTTTANIPSIKAATFKHGVTKPSKVNVPVNVTIPTTLAPGDYHIIVIVNDSSPNGSPAQTNNTIALSILGVPITITATLGAASVSTDLSATGLPSPIVAGSTVKGKFTLTFNNTGNIPTSSAGTYNIALFLHPSSGSDIPLITLTNQTLPIIKAGDNQTISTSLPLSAIATAAVPAGTYTIEATLTPVNGTTGSPFTVPGPSITFSAGSNTGNTTPLKHGSTIKFTCNTQLTGSNFLEFGNFTIGAHVSGSYTFNPSGLELTYSTGDADILAVTFLTGQTFMDPTLDGNPTTVIFSTDPTGAFASILDSGSTTQFFAKFA